MNEKSLISSCQSGDKSAFNALLNLQYDNIYRTAYRWCGDPANAQDITQIACMKLARTIAQFKFESSFSSWLYKLTINCAKDFYKSPSQRNVREEQVKNLESTASTVKDQNARRLYARQILEQISDLQEDLKDTLMLVYGKGLSHGQAAQELDIKESTVSWRVHEARKLLKQTFHSSDINAPLGEEAVRGSV